MGRMTPQSKLKNAKSIESKTMSRDKYNEKNVSVDTNEESTGTISQKHYGHVTKTCNALCKGDPFGQHRK